MAVVWLGYPILVLRTAMTNNTPSFWGIKKQNRFTEMELALMEGGQSLPEKVKEVNYSFIKELPTLGPLSLRKKASGQLD